jgi:aryl-alcohol dehydrogenase-like predicted oxidoreductase
MEQMQPSAGAADRLADRGGRLRLHGGREINRLGFGAMRLTGPGVWGPPADRKTALQVLRRAIELGIELIDTADSYGPEVSEELIAEALHPYPSTLLIATKGGLTRPAPGDWRRDARPAHLTTSCEASLRRLRVDCIELYQLHAPDPRVPFEDSIGTLVRLKEQGKIRHIGVSNVSLAELRRARALVDVVSVQNRYNVAERRFDDVLALCEREGIAFLPWSPLSSGPSAGTLRNAALIARRRGATTAQVAIAWLLARSPVMVPIPGTSSIAHLEENVAAATLRLHPEDVAELER